MSLISISIDIAGSTRLKQLIKKISKGNQDNINRLYREYAGKIYSIEMDLYVYLQRNGLDLDNLFVIKTIGDESWFAYELKDIETKTLQFNKIFHTIYRSLTYIHSRYYDIFISERELLPGEALNKDWIKSIKFEWPDIAAKAYMDLIKDYEEIGNVRRNVFLKNCRDFFPNDELRLGQKYESDKLSKLISNFNIGYFRGMIGNNVKISHRFDPIGFEVDLFFRCTKFGLPGITGIGKNLFENLYQEKLQIINPDSLYRNYQFPIGSTGELYNYDLLCNEIKKTRLKGIGENYNIYYLINKNDLPAAVKLRTDERRGIYKKTIDFLKKYNFWDK